MPTSDSTVIRDQNRKTIWWGLSSVDGVSLVPIQIDSITRGILIENGTSTMPIMSAVPQTIPREGNRIPALAGVSNDGQNTIIPVSVNPSTGALMVQNL